MDDVKHYRKVFRDIIRGYSEVIILDKSYFIKHLSSLDQVSIDEIEDKYLTKALDRGIPSREEVLATLFDSGDWTEQEEGEIKKLESFIEQLQKNKTQLVLKSEIDKQNETIIETRAKITELELKKKNLLSNDAESCASKRSHDYYIIKSYYEDKELEKPLFPEESSYEDLYMDEVSAFVDTYNKTFRMFEELKIQEMILQDFYYIYFPFSDDTVGFFGNPVSKLTYNQLKLIVYTKIFKNIFENNKHIPEKIKKDPQALLDYGAIDEDAKQKMKDKLSGDKDGSTLFNATEEDYEYAGLDKPSDSSKISLQEAAKQKGGSLSMEDLMELSGHRTE